ncbi:MAG: FAD/NAD(P)-binding protein, partial [Lacipirellulaceae bacterium]
MRLAIVGFGPKGLFCLESLAAELAESEATPRVLIDVYEPHTYPGAGVVYDPTQPAYLLMNYAAKYVNAWSKTERDKPGKLSLVEWLAVFRPEYACAEKFIPRATVGEYLTWCLQQILLKSPSPVTVRFLRSRVTSVSRQSAWSIKSVAEASGSISHFSYDSVLLTTGHGHLSGVEKAGGMLRVYPTDDWLSEARIKPASRVRIRGFALTWIDATLALTEGRGGSFTRGGLDELKYHASGLEPAI